MAQGWWSLGARRINATEFLLECVAVELEQCVECLVFSVQSHAGGKGLDFLFRCGEGFVDNLHTGSNERTWINERTAGGHIKASAWLAGSRRKVDIAYRFP